MSKVSQFEFLAAYKAIVANAVAKLRDNSFACFVVGDYRDEKGFLSNFVSQTIDAFIEAGAGLYNHAILREPIGHAAIRASKIFEYRKFTNVHQHVLIFCKGDPKEAAARNKG